MSGVTKVLFGKTPSVKVDDTARIEAERQRKLSREEAAAAEARKAAVDERDRKRKRNVAQSGRESTLLAGGGSGTLLGQ